MAWNVDNHQRSTLEAGESKKVEFHLRFANTSDRIDLSVSSTMEGERRAFAFSLSSIVSSHLLPPT